jgi:hypothetical protein
MATMATWKEEKRTILEYKAKLDEKTTDTSIDTLVNEMNASILRYTNQAGISNNPEKNPDYTNANEKFKTLQKLQNEYTILIKRLSSYIRKSSDMNDVSNKLRHVGELRNSITNLEKELKDAKNDSETSRTRQSTLTTTHANLSWYQGFGGYIGFIKPLHQFSIPFLLGFGLFLLFLSGLVLREFFLPIANSNSYISYNSSTEGSIFSYFTDSRFIAALGGGILVSVVLLILSLTGRLGKNVR